MKGNCRANRRPPEDVIEAEWVECEFQDSSVYGGRHWPSRQVHPMSLAAGDTRKVETFAPVPQTLYVTVISGVLSLWFGEAAGDPRPAGDQAHMEFVSGQGPSPVILPPGAHSLIFGAANSAACVATAVVMDREGHK